MNRKLFSTAQGIAAPRCTALLPLALVLSSGCAHYSTRPLERSQQASAMIEQREADGLYVAVRDISNSRESLKLFGRELAHYGYVPVLVLLELDRDSRASFDVQRQDLQLCLRTGKRLLTVPPSTVADDVSFSHIRSAIGFIFILPGFFVASSVNRANEQMENDYEEKALESVRINPNVRTSSGVVFFQIPKEARKSFSLEDAFVEVKVHLRGGPEVVGRTLEFPVHFGK
jgi:hypothetical protein